MTARPIEIKDGPTAKRAVEQVLRTDDRRGGEAPAGVTQRRLSPTQVAVFAPPGTRRGTLESIVAKLSGGHVETQPRKAGDGRAVLCLVFDVGYQEPRKRGPKDTKVEFNEAIAPHRVAVLTQGRARKPKAADAA